MFLFLGDVRLAKMSVLIGTGPYKLLKKDPKVHERRLHSDNIGRDGGVGIPEAWMPVSGKQRETATTASCQGNSLESAGLFENQNSLEQNRHLILH